MSDELTPLAAGRTVAVRVSDAVRHTALAVRGAVTRRDGALVLGGVAAAYLLVYLVALGHLGAGDGSVTLVVVEDPFGRALEQRTAVQYEPIALVALGPVEFLFSPVDTLIGATIAALVGANAAVSWVAWRRPRACHVRPGVGLVAGVPGLLSGAACCAPTILISVGVQASAGLLVVFQWLVPAAIAMLIATLLWVGTQVEEPTAGS